MCHLPPCLLHLPDLLLRWTTWQPPAARMEPATVSSCSSRRIVKSTIGTFFSAKSCIKVCRHKVLTNVLFHLFQAPPPPTGRYGVALLILVGVTLILVITGIFSYRHLSSLRVSTLIVLENNSRVAE